MLIIGQRPVGNDGQGLARHVRAPFEPCDEIAPDRHGGPPGIEPQVEGRGESPGDDEQREEVPLSAHDGVDDADQQHHDQRAEKELVQSRGAHFVLQ